MRGQPRRVGHERVSHGLHVRTTRPLDPVERLQALSAVLPPSSAFTHLTAAAVRGWWLPPPVSHPVFVAVPLGERYPERAGVRVARLATSSSAELVRGVPLAPAADTLLALARDLGPLDLVPVADSALRQGDCTLADLVEVSTGRRRGAPALRAVLPLLDRRAESAWESVLRVLHRVAEIEVEPQYEVRDDRGGFIARADLWLVGTRRLHEYDGGVHRRPDQHRRDLDRDRRLIEAGWQRCGYTATEVLNRGAHHRLRRCSAGPLLGRAAGPGLAGAGQRLAARARHAGSARRPLATAGRRQVARPMRMPSSRSRCGARIDL